MDQRSDGADHPDAGYVGKYRILGELGRGLPEGCVFVTGTNGKTTTCRLLAGMLEAAGLQVTANRDGSNLSRGLVGALVRDGGAEGGAAAGDVGVFEVDEGALPAVSRELPPRVLVVLDLFRDQLDRYGEVDTLAGRLGAAASALPDTRVLLDADDPLVAELTPDAGRFGIEDASAASRASAQAADAVRCRHCGGRLAFDVRYYAHLGRWHCPSCGRGRPAPGARLTDVSLGLEGSAATLVTPAGEARLAVPLPGLYNLYNALAASSAAVELGVSPEVVAASLRDAHAAFGRMERMRVHDRELLLLLVKNPTGFTQAAETLAREGRPRHLLLALNDHLTDGTDTSWVWDAEVELLRDVAVHITASGTRAEEIALRCKYAGIEPAIVTVEPGLAAAVRGALREVPPGEPLCVLPTYTAMTGIRAALARGGWVREALA
jgi:UDP-N-acetylmuramyl tripeptide synthase